MLQILVDGMHLFDFTLVDAFYACLLLRVGGVLCIDDVKHPGVASWMAYVRANYPHMELRTNTRCDSTMATFVKAHEDERAWNFHNGVFDTSASS